MTSNYDIAEIWAWTVWNDDKVVVAKIIISTLSNFEAEFIKFIF